MKNPTINGRCVATTCVYEDEGGHWHARIAMVDGTVYYNCFGVRTEGDAEAVIRRVLDPIDDARAAIAKAGGKA